MVTFFHSILSIFQNFGDKWSSLLYHEEGVISFEASWMLMPSYTLNIATGGMWSISSMFYIGVMAAY
jgi:hypothetical protein